MLYLIGLGLNVDGISVFGMEAVKKCKKVYLENYTVDFPYSFEELQHTLDKKIEKADRDFVESLQIIDEAAKKDVALLVYGSPLTATTHITILQEAKASGVRTKLIYNASILDAIAETGLQLYKFGKTASMPAWKKSYEPDSFMKTVQENLSMNAHSLILVDIGLEYYDAMYQLKVSAEKHGIPLKKIVVCQALGTKNKKIRVGPMEKMELERFQSPYCIIIPSKLHFVEKDVLDEFKVR